MSLYWTLFLLAILIAFAVGETYAFRSGNVTLSRYVVYAHRAWPLLGPSIGLVVGGLLVHFFWPWCPDLGIGTG